MQTAESKLLVMCKWSYLQHKCCKTKNKLYKLGILTHLEKRKCVWNLTENSVNLLLIKIYNIEKTVHRILL
jgi:hypothetical protein